MTCASPNQLERCPRSQLSATGEEFHFINPTEQKMCKKHPEFELEAGIRTSINTENAVALCNSWAHRRQLGRHAGLRAPSCVLAKVSIHISSPVLTTRRRTTKCETLFVFGTPKLRVLPCKAAAFLSESINRVTITGRNLIHDSDSTASEAKKYLGLHDISAVAQGT